MALKVIMIALGVLMGVPLIALAVILVDYNLLDQGYYLSEDEKEVAERILAHASRSKNFSLSVAVGGEQLAVCLVQQYDDPNRVVIDEIANNKNLSGPAPDRVNYELSIMDGLWAVAVLRPDRNIDVYPIPRRKFILEGVSSYRSYCAYEADRFEMVDTTNRGHEIKVLKLVNR